MELQPKNRLAFVDLHRGIVLLIMIEVHVFNAMLIPPLKETGWFTVLNFINGLVAPSFIFISGFSFILASKKKLEEFRKFGMSFWKQIGRIFLIFIVGYSLRLPYLSLLKMKKIATVEQVTASLAVDVLQCIAVGLLIIFIVRIIIKSDKIFKYVLFFLGFVFVWLAPFFWQVDLHKEFPIWFANYFNKKNGSLFPLFPWLGFMFFSALISMLYLDAKTIGRDKEFFKKLFYASILFILVGHLTLLESSPLRIKMPPPNYFFFILRLGYILLIFYFSKVFCEHIDMHKSLILDVSRQSLLVYWLHLQLIFKKLWNNQSLEIIVKQSFGVLESIGMTLLFILLMVIVAKVWGFIKTKYPSVVQWVTIGVISISIIIFLFD